MGVATIFFCIYMGVPTIFQPVQVVAIFFQHSTPTPPTPPYSIVNSQACYVAAQVNRMSASHDMVLRAGASAARGRGPAVPAQPPSPPCSVQVGTERRRNNGGASQRRTETKKNIFDLLKNGDTCKIIFFTVNIDFSCVLRKAEVVEDSIPNHILFCILLAFAPTFNPQQHLQGVGGGGATIRFPTPPPLGVM